MIVYRLILAKAIDDLSDAERAQILSEIRRFIDMPADEVAKAALPCLVMRWNEEAPEAPKVRLAPTSDIERCFLESVDEKAKEALGIQPGLLNAQNKAQTLWRHSSAKKVLIACSSATTNKLLSLSQLLLSTIVNIFTSKDSRIEFQKSQVALIALNQLGTNDPTILLRWRDVADSNKEPIVICVHFSLKVVEMTPLGKFLESWEERDVDRSVLEQRKREQWSKGIVSFIMLDDRQMFSTSFENMLDVLSKKLAVPPLFKEL